MEETLRNREKRRYPRVFVDLPLEYRDEGDSTLRGAIVVNAGDGGFLIQSTRDIPLGTKLKVNILFPKEFELANFEAVTRIVRKEPYREEDWRGNQVWEGYQYGLEFMKVLEEDRWKLNWLLGGRFVFEEIFQTLFCQL